LARLLPCAMCRKWVTAFKAAAERRSLQLRKDPATLVMWLHKPAAPVPDDFTADLLCEHQCLSVHSVRSRRRVEARVFNFLRSKHSGTEIRVRSRPLLAAPNPCLA
jgi:hypothetical protein